MLELVDEDCKTFFINIFKGVVEKVHLMGNFSRELEVLKRVFLNSH